MQIWFNKEAILEVILQLSNIKTEQLYNVSNQQPDFIGLVCVECIGSLKMWECSAVAIEKEI